MSQEMENDAAVVSEMFAAHYDLCEALTSGRRAGETRSTTVNDRPYSKLVYNLMWVIGLHWQQEVTDLREQLMDLVAAQIASDFAVENAVQMKQAAATKCAAALSSLPLDDETREEVKRRIRDDDIVEDDREEATEDAQEDE